MRLSNQAAPDCHCHHSLTGVDGVDQVQSASCSEPVVIQTIQEHKERDLKHSSFQKAKRKNQTQVHHSCVCVCTGSVAVL